MRAHTRKKTHKNAHTHTHTQHTQTKLELHLHPCACRPSAIVVRENLIKIDIAAKRTQLLGRAIEWTGPEDFVCKMMRFQNLGGLRKVLYPDLQRALHAALQLWKELEEEKVARLAAEGEQEQYQYVPRPLGERDMSPSPPRPAKRQRLGKRESICAGEVPRPTLRTRHFCGTSR